MDSGGATTSLLTIDQVLLRSGDVGVSQCSFQGRWQEKPVQLHVFLTACGAGNATGEVHVAGFFFLHDLQPARTTQLAQMPEAFDWARRADALTLKSWRSGQTWPVSLRLAEPWSHSHKHRYPGRLSATLRLDHPEDRRLLEFHVVAQPGFHSFCTFLPGANPGAPWPSPQSWSPWGAPRWQQQGGEDGSGGLKRCAWLQQPAPPPPRSYVVVSPFFGLSAAQIVSLLEHHMRYHAVLGVERYLIYLEEGAPALALEPRIQALVSAGKLRLVLWDALPHFDADDPGRRPDLKNLTSTKGVRQPYGLQTLVYNHALMSLWHENAVAAIVDLDEYLMTPAKTTMAQVMRNCASGPKVASLQIMRRAGYCSSCVTALWGGQPPGASPHTGGGMGADALRAAHPLERALWLNVPLAAGGQITGSVLQSLQSLPRPAHPLALYGMVTAEAEPKSLVLAHGIAFTNPHVAFPVRGRHFMKASGQCAWWMHLRTQIDPRLPGKIGSTQPVARNFFWVLDELAGGAETGTPTIPAFVREAADGPLAYNNTPGSGLTLLL